MHPVRFEPEQRCQYAPRRMDALRGVEQGESPAVPLGDGRVRLHRVVVLDGGRVDMVDRRACGRQRRVDIAFRNVRLLTAVHALRGVRVRVVDAESRIVRGLVVRVPHQARRIARFFRSFGQHGADDLPAEADVRGLQDGKLQVVGRSKLRRIGMRQHGKHARGRFGCRRIERGNPSRGDPRQHRKEVEGTFGPLLISKGRQAADLQLAVDAGRTHCSSDSSLNTAVKVPRSSRRLNSLPGSGSAAASSASAAAS